MNTYGDVQPLKSFLTLSKNLNGLIQRDFRPGIYQV